MDDANLAKLSVNQPGLKPDFDKNIVNYELIVASNVDKLTVKSVPSDKGASIATKSPSGYGENVQLKEGLNEIIVEVTSEDGTVKKYFLNCKRLSASDANLKLIELSSTELIPKFDPTQLEYKVNVNFRVAEIRFKCEVFDSSCSLEILGNNKSLSKSEDSFHNLALNFGISEILVKVTSPNKANNQTYKIEIIRDALPRIGFFENIKSKLDYEDPITLGPIHCAVKHEARSNGLVYSSQVVDVFRKIALPDKLNRISSQANQRECIEFKRDVDGENRIAELTLKIPYLNGSYSKESSLKHLFQCVDEVNSEDQYKLNENEPKFENVLSVANFSENIPTYQVKSWEKQMQIIYDETDAEKLIKASSAHFEKYISMVNSNNSALFKKNQNDSPLYYLNMSIFNLATSLKFKSSNYQTHFRLGLLLEEKNFYESLYGTEKSDEQKEVLTLNSQNKMAAESSKDEEIEAICRAHGVAATASDAEKLKALDQEYHHLIETQQNAKAEQVQLLYQFKSKKIITSNKSSTKLIDDKGNYLVQAHLKYLDGIKLVIDSKTTNFNAYLTLGRSFCQIGDYVQALGFLKHCINWSDKQMQAISRFYFAYALCKQDDQEVLKSNSQLVVYYLSIGLQMFLASLCSSLSNRAVAFADDSYSIFNTMFLEAFVLLGKVRHQFQVKLNGISVEHSFKYASWLSCLALVEINKRAKLDKELRNTSELIRKLMSILIDAHSSLINLEIRFDSNDLNDQRDLIAKRCTNLIDLIRSSTERDNIQTLKLQEKIGELLVYAEPLNSYNLLLIACFKLELYDFLVESRGENESELAYLLDECKTLLNASIEYEANANLDVLSNGITDQNWWKKLVEENAALAKQAEMTRLNSASKKQSINKIDPTPVNKTQIASKPNAITKPQQTKKPTTTPAASSKNTKPVQVTAKPDCKKTSAETVSKPSQETGERKSPAEVKKEPENVVKYRRRPTTFDKNALNIQIQLCLARTYSRLKEFDNAKACYDKCIKLEPKNQDAYIELATMLRQNGDFMGAVDVYSMYPVDEKILSVSEKSDDSRNQNFDDAFIYGELVTLLVNNKQYDDPRLPNYLILWAKIMGIAIIDKYIGILDKANKTKICKQVYAGVHNKSVEDADLVQFFKFKGWF